MRKQVELLAPAGSFECLQAAVQNGCDAVYLGGSMFGARAFANNFDEEEMLQAIQYAHGYGVKVYVTMNTLLFEDEMSDALAYAKFLYEANVDALIIQDLGLFDACHQLYPDLELHASTQMHIHTKEGIQFLQNAGAKRVVVPRETTIENIKHLSSYGVDLEVFVQGALCVSYSGQCLMSAKELSRSGNRGECAQMCRMRYRLVKEEQEKQTYIESDGAYLLSPKDLNTLHQVPELIEAGIASFKIEGRMKRPAYVALMVSYYRKAIDAYYANQAFHEQEADRQMQMMFHRGFTQGHLFHQMGKALMNSYRPNHMGIEVGQVIKANAQKITIRLSDTIRQGDGLRFLNEKEDQGCNVNMLYHNGLLVAQAKQGDIVEIPYRGFVEKGASVLKTSDKQQIDAMLSTYEKPQRKVNIEMHVSFHKGEPLQLKIQDKEGFEVVCESTSRIEKAMKTPLDQERLHKQLSKCGDTMFDVKTIVFDMDKDAILPIKEVNQLRREALEALTRLRKERTYPKTYGSYQRTFDVLQEQQSYVVVRTKEQYECVKQYANRKLFVDGYSLYQELCKNDTSIGYHGERVMSNPYPQGSVMFCENGGISTKGIADHFVNITNSYAAAFLFAHGVEAIVFSSECSDEQCKKIIEACKQRYGCDGNFIQTSYGYEELMVSEYCPINMCVKDNNKQNCGLCKGSTSYFLEDIKGKQYPLYGDEVCRMHLLSEKPDQKDVQNISQIIQFYKESENDVTMIMDKVSHKLR